MQVILKRDVNKIGSAGDLLEVSDGYARNFLLPRGLAEEATTGKIADMKTRQQNRKAKEEKEKLASEEVKKKLQDRLIRVEAIGGENGKLFGSVTAAQIAEAIEAQFGIRIDKKNIRLPDPVRQPGNHALSIRLHAGVQAGMILSVEIRGAENRNP
ncbi:MAG: 50S ribosomal protein L9 [Synergistaceae bacterium]|jgi:large subunit ribosomal protein L9|nr:50S ribosomal protein L9 [Synergistaceae bacterium]